MIVLDLILKFTAAAFVNQISFSNCYWNRRNVFIRDFF